MSDIFTTAVIRATPIVVPIRNSFYYKINLKMTVTIQIYQSMHARFISDDFLITLLGKNNILTVDRIDTIR